MKFVLSLLALAASAFAAPADSQAATANIQCRKAVNGTLQLVLDNPNISRTGASFNGPLYDVNGVRAKLLKIFAPQNYEVCLF
jgi:hypothetical protein